MRELYVIVTLVLTVVLSLAPQPPRIIPWLFDLTMTVLILAWPVTLPLAMLAGLAKRKT